jgi:hypothetical protein
MLEYDLKLNNFFYGVKPVLLEQEFPRKFFVTSDRKFIEIEPLCPCCNSYGYVVHNGWHGCKAKVVKELGLEIKNGQYWCKKCGCYWSVRCEEVDCFIEQYKQVVTGVVFDLYIKGLSLRNVIDHVQSCLCYSVSHEWVRQVYVEAAEMVEQAKVLETSGVFHYDEQFLSQGVRITLKDSVTKKVILDQLFNDKRRETIIEALNKALKPYKKVVLIADMDSKYPGVLKELYHGKVEIQWCIFHLYRLIGKEFKQAYKGKSFPLEQLLNKYEIFNIFFNHQLEMNFLRQQLRKFEQRKKLLKKSKKLSEKEKREKLKEYEKKLKKEFNEYLASLKKNRRRKNGTKLKVRTKESAEYYLIRIEKVLKAFFPKKLKERIKYVRKHWNKFTTFYNHDNVPPTNNGIEQYFSATLQKTSKKRFRTKKSTQLRLNIFKAKNNNVKIFKPVNFFTFMLLFAKIANLFLIT